MSSRFVDLVSDHGCAMKSWHSESTCAMWGEGENLIAVLPPTSAAPARYLILPSAPPGLEMPQFPTSTLPQCGADEADWWPAQTTTTTLSVPEFFYKRCRLVIQWIKQSVVFSRRENIVTLWSCESLLTQSALSVIVDMIRSERIYAIEWVNRKTNTAVTAARSYSLLHINGLET